MNNALENQKQKIVENLVKKIQKGQHTTREDLKPYLDLLLENGDISKVMHMKLSCGLICTLHSFFDHLLETTDIMTYRTLKYLIWEEAPNVAINENDDHPPVEGDVCLDGVTYANNLGSQGGLSKK